MTEGLSTAPTEAGRSRHRKFLIAATAAAISLVLLELAAALLTVVVNPRLDTPIPRRGPVLAGQSRQIEALLNDPDGREQIHPVRGWGYRAGYASGLDTINAAGLRSVREYERAPSSGVLRIAAFGDSFTYCNEVANHECWASVIEQKWRAEVLNYGVGGYGTDQAFLRYLAEGRELSPDVVLIGFAPVDLRRIVSRYRRFIRHGDGPWFKPRFVMTGDSLSLIPTPVKSRADAERILADPYLVREIGELDQWYERALYESELYRWSATFRLLSNGWTRLDRRYFDPDRLTADGVFRTQSEAFRIQTAVFDAFADSVRSHGSRPIVLMLPVRNDVERRSNGQLPSYAPLKQELTRHGLEVIDPLDAFFPLDRPIPELFRPLGHYSPPANEVVARAVAAFLSLESLPEGPAR